MAVSAHAKSRLMKDSLELERAHIPSIAAKCLENNIFEWHCNIQSTTPVYQNIYFHLIIIFPQNYPVDPPQIKIKTPIKHPNITDQFLCLSMLRKNTNKGWSSSYSLTSILMQLQLFLFADTKIDQDGGYSNVTKSISICKNFVCLECGHSHDNPIPKIKSTSSSASSPAPSPSPTIKMRTNQPKYVTIRASNCYTTHTQSWVSAFGEVGIKCTNNTISGIYYESLIEWNGCHRFGFGTSSATICGVTCESFGYEGVEFNQYDTITVALDFKRKSIYFGKNGKLLNTNDVSPIYINKYLLDKELFPMVSFKNTQTEFNFSTPKKPISWLIDNGFKTFDELLKIKQKQTNNNNKIVSEINSSLSNEIERFFAQTRPSTEDVLAKIKFTEYIESCVKYFHQDKSVARSACSTFIFGSESWDTSNNDSDIDMAISLNDNDNSRSNKKLILNKLAQLILAHDVGGNLRIKLLLNASYPIICIQHRNNLKIDLSVADKYCQTRNELILETINRYKDYNMRKLIIFIKYWTRTRKLNDSYNGYLNSFGWMILIIKFMQSYSLNNNRNKNKFNLGQVVFHFFMFYSQIFDFDKYVVEIRGDNTFYNYNNCNDLFCLVILDPMTSSNVAKQVGYYQMSRIKNEINRSYEICKKHCKFDYNSKFSLFAELTENLNIYGGNQAQFDDESKEEVYFNDNDDDSNQSTNTKISSISTL